MGSLEFTDSFGVFALLEGWSDIQAGAAHTDRFGKLPLKAWVDLIQSG